MDINQVKVLIRQCDSIKEVLEQLGFKKNNSNQRAKLLELIKTNELDVQHFGTRPRVLKSSRWSNDLLIKESALQSNSIGDFLVKMGLSSKGSNRDTANFHLKRLNIDISHWDSKILRLSGILKHSVTKQIALLEILQGLHPTYPTYVLKKRLIKEGLKENKCEECGISEWNNKPLAIHLDHIDGISTNHKRENLRMLCPNCHSQTHTYAGKKRI